MANDTDVAPESWRLAFALRRALAGLAAGATVVLTRWALAWAYRDLDTWADVVEDD